MDPFVISLQMRTRANWSNFITLLTVWIVIGSVSAWVAPSFTLENSPSAILDINAVRTVLNDNGPRGRTLYCFFLVLDTVSSVVSAGLLSIVLTASLDNMKNELVRVSNVLPFLVAALAIAKNFALFFAIWSFSSMSSVVLMGGLSVTLYNLHQLASIITHAAVVVALGLGLYDFTHGIGRDSRQVIEKKQ